MRSSAYSRILVRSWPEAGLAISAMNNRKRILERTVTFWNSSTTNMYVKRMNHNLRIHSFGKVIISLQPRMLFSLHIDGSLLPYGIKGKETGWCLTSDFDQDIGFNDRKAVFHRVTLFEDLRKGLENGDRFVITRKARIFVCLRIGAICIPFQPTMGGGRSMSND